MVASIRLYCSILFAKRKQKIRKLKFMLFIFIMAYKKRLMIGLSSVRSLPKNTKFILISGYCI